MKSGSSKLVDDCFLHDKDRLKHDEALNILETRLQCVVDTEQINLAEGHRRMVAQDVTAPRNIPGFDNSAVDGYAYRHEDFEKCGGYFPVVTRIPAGTAEEIELPSGSAARIFTGAAMPVNADTVAMQEDCEPHSQDGGNFVAIPPGLKSGANCRLAGEDVETGSTVVENGQCLRAQDLAAIASTGIDILTVFKRLKTALISSGDEIIRPGDPFGKGGVFDANHFMIQALLADMGMDCEDLGVATDNRLEVEQILNSASGNFDVIISTGGASKGEEDHFIDALEQSGSMHMWQLAIKPGRPMCFGQIGDTVVFTLPGNPVAAFVCFLLYVRPSLSILGGGKWRSPQRISMPSGFSLKSKPDRREFLRGFFSTDQDGKQHVQKFERDGSGLITGLRMASCLVEIPENVTSVDIGQPLDVIPLSEFGITV